MCVYVCIYKRCDLKIAEMSSAMHLVMLMYGYIGVVAAKNLVESSKFSSILVFGDSTVDPGNNNYLLTISKANYFPYGIDFPGHVATGRFSNGKLVSDFLASALNIKDTVPPFLNPDLSDQELLTGVSFASGESGIDDFTASLTNVLSMDQQLQYFKAYTMKLKQIVGEDQAMQRLQHALVLISVGTNDFILNFHDFPSRRLMFITIDAYQDYLLDKFDVMIKVREEIRNS